MLRDHVKLCAILFQLSGWILFKLLGLCFLPTQVRLHVSAESKLLRKHWLRTPQHTTWNENLSAVFIDCYSIWVHPNQQIFHDVSLQNYGKPSQFNSTRQELSGSFSHPVGLWTVWSVQSKEKPFKSTWDSMTLYSVDFFWMLVFSLGSLSYLKGKLWNLRWWCGNVCEGA